MKCILNCVFLPVQSDHIITSNIFQYEFEREALSEGHDLHGAPCGKRVNYIISPTDVADVAVDAILDKACKRQIYTLTGPMSVTDEDVATVLSKHLGTRITFVEKPLIFFDTQTGELEKIRRQDLRRRFPWDILTIRNTLPTNWLQRIACLPLSAMLCVLIFVNSKQVK